jgi:hypothetical protein
MRTPLMGVPNRTLIITGIFLLKPAPCATSSLETTPVLVLDNNVGRMAKHAKRFQQYDQLDSPLGF